MRDPEALLKKFCLQYLRRNVETVRVLQEMNDIIRRMEKRLPFLVITKCIDGRTHGTRSKGLPPLLRRVLLRRTDGNKVDPSPSNYFFWDPIGERISLSEQEGSGTPTLFIALAHTSKLEHGCAAHLGDDAAALSEVSGQSRAVAERFQNKVFSLHGMTNTDDLSHIFIFPDGHTIDVDALIRELQFDSPPDVFHEHFLLHPIPDSALRPYIGDCSVSDLFEGDRPAFYDDLRKSIAAQVFLLEQTDRAVLSEKNDVWNPRLFSSLRQKLNSISGLPGSLHIGLLYMIASNVAYTLYKRRLLSKMKPAEREQYLGHSEELICYGEGFQTLGRNDALLVKPGRGNDGDALKIAKKVLDSVRSKYPQGFAPLVHVNIEIRDDDLSPSQLARVKAELANRAYLVRTVFGHDPVRILTTYSKESEKMFYPLHIDDANGSSVETGFDTGKNIRSTSNRRDIDLRERAYFHAMAGDT